MTSPFENDSELNAVAINGKGFFNSPPSSTPPDNYVIIYNPALGVHAYFGVDFASSVKSTTSIANYNLTENSQCDTDVQNSGTATFGKSGLSLSTAGQNSGTASMRIHSWANGDSLNTFSISALTFQTHGSIDPLNGDGQFFAGIVDQSGYTMLTNASTTEGVWLYWVIASGTETLYFCTSDGVSVTATDITGENGSIIDLDNKMSFVFSQGAISVYSNGDSTPLATHTTNLPDGAATNDYLFMASIVNGASDTQTRTKTIYNVSAYV